MFLRSIGIDALNDYKMLKSGKPQYELFPLLQAGKNDVCFLIIHSGFASPFFKKKTNFCKLICLTFWCKFPL